MTAPEPLWLYAELVGALMPSAEELAKLPSWLRVVEHDDGRVFVWWRVDADRA